MMIPKFDIDIEKIDEVDYADQTYAIELRKNIIAGQCEGLEAIQQAIYLILNTERYDYVIFTPNYGIEINDLIGMKNAYVVSELKRRIKEALMQDDRIEDVDHFELSTKKNKIHCRFRVSTIFGTLHSESEVTV